MLSEMLNGQPIPSTTLLYFRERFRSRLYDLVVAEFLRREASELTYTDIGRRLNVYPCIVEQWLASPGNWTLDTASDLSLVIAKSEPLIVLNKLEKYVTQSVATNDAAPTNPRT